MPASVYKRNLIVKRKVTGTKELINILYKGPIPFFYIKAPKSMFIMRKVIIANAIKFIIYYIRKYSTIRIVRY